MKNPISDRISFTLNPIKIKNTLRNLPSIPFGKI